MDPLKYIFCKPILNYRLSKWQLIIQQFDIVYVTQKSIKGQGITNHLSATSTGGYGPLETYFPEDEVMDIQLASREDMGQFWKLYFDGASNAEGAGAKAVLVSITGDQYLVAIKLHFNNSNNTAEYEGCIVGLKLAQSMGVKRLAVFSDLELVIRQSTGAYTTKELHLLPYHRHVIKLAREFEHIAFMHIPQNRNDFADALATLASLVSISARKGMSVITFIVQNTPSYGNNVGEISQKISPTGPPYQRVFARQINP